jgi:DNA-binding CsgD family transcriptional regulator
MNVIAKTSCIEVGTERADDIPAEEHYAVIIVVDRAMDVVLQPSHPALAYESFETAPVTDGRLAPELEASVREAARNWIAGDPHPEKSTFSIPPSHIVRAQPLAGSNGNFLALTIEHRRERHALSRARKRFDLTPREQQVLRFILEGAQASEIAAALHIAESTVQGYFKRLLAKTRSRNRASMVALVLEWNVRWERTSTRSVTDASA